MTKATKATKATRATRGIRWLLMKIHFFFWRGRPHCPLCRLGRLYLKSPPFSAILWDDCDVKTRFHGLAQPILAALAFLAVHAFPRVLLELLDVAFGERIQEEFAVGFGEDAVVEDDNDAGVGLAADQASEALAEAKDGFGD